MRKTLKPASAEICAVDILLSLTWCLDVGRANRKSACTGTNVAIVQVLEFDLSVSRLAGTDRIARTILQAVTAISRIRL